MLSIVANNEHIAINSLDDVKQVASKLKIGESVALKVMRRPQGAAAPGSPLTSQVPSHSNAGLADPRGASKLAPFFPTSKLCDFQLF